MKFVILCNGTMPSGSLIYRECERADQIIACDGGIAMAKKYGLKPDLLVGDFDSFAKEEAVQLQKEWNCELLEFNTDKDETDTQIGVDLAIQAGATEIVLLGATGTRFDHTLGNVSLLVRCERQGISAVMKDDHNEIYATCTLKMIAGEIGDMLSIIPLGINAVIYCTDGLRYPLYDQELDLGDTRPISNEFNAKEALIEMKHGWVCIVHAKE